MRAAPSPFDAASSAGSAGRTRCPAGAPARGGLERAAVVLWLSQRFGGNHVTDQTPNPARKPAGPRSSPMRLVVPIALGLVVGSIIYFGYIWWSHHQGGAQAAADAPG